jgi:hypothetical protein
MNESKNNISRRSFLLIIFAVGTGGFFAGKYITYDQRKGFIKSFADPFEDTELEEIFSKLDEFVIKIGKKYLETSTAINTKAEILLELNSSGFPGIVDKRTIKRFKNSVHSDFTHNRIIEVNGFLLSLTEVYLCAIYYLVYINKIE